MKKTMKRLLKWVGGTLLGIVLLLVVAVLLLNTSMVQGRLVEEAVGVLKEKLQTEVKVGKFQVRLIGQDVRLEDVEIEDQQHRKMFMLKELGVKLDLRRLLDREIKITDAKVKGLEAHLYKDSTDTVANYQFFIDAFKKKHKAKAKEEKKDTVKKHKMNIDFDQVKLEDIKLTYNKESASLGGLFIRKDQNDMLVGEVHDLASSWVKKTKKGPVDTRLHIGTIRLSHQDGQHQLNITGIRYITDNGKPRKNFNKPKRGFFDVGHLDLLAEMDVNVLYTGKDSVVAEIVRFQAQDSVSGIDVRKLKARVEANKQVAHVKQFSISLPNTTLRFDEATLQLPSKKKGRKLAYSTSLITGTTLLKDISRVFAPVLKNFTEPLYLQTTMTGNDEGMQFNNVKVHTKQKDLTISAKGYITGLKDKYKLHVHFDVNRMTAQGGSKERIISHFPVKKFMMKQLHNLGTIGYIGTFDVLWKREQFAGLLITKPGNINFSFALNENTKYVEGTVRTDSFELGQAMDMPDLKKVACQATFKFDISKPRTAIMRKKVGGKLPMGEITAEVFDAKYKLLHVRNTIATIKSNGAVAEGEVNVRGKRLDVLCSFSFTNTNEMQKMKIKPKLKLHGLLGGTKKKSEPEAPQVSDAELRAARIQQRAEERVARNAEREVLKAQREQERADRQAKKEAAKAARQAERDARDAARKAEKEARRAEREAAKAAQQKSE